MTGADRAWANHYDIGDVVRYSRGSKAAGIEAGSYATVAAINPSQNQLAVQKEFGESITYDPRRLTGVSVYREAIHDFAVGIAYSSLLQRNRSVSPTGILPSSNPSHPMAA